MSSALRHCGALVLRTAAGSTSRIVAAQQVRNFGVLRTAPVLTPVALAHFRQAYRGHKNFGHKPDVMPVFTRLWQTFLGVMMFSVWVDWAA